MSVETFSYLSLIFEFFPYPCCEAILFLKLNHSMANGKSPIGFDSVGFCVNVYLQKAISPDLVDVYNMHSSKDCRLEFSMLIIMFLTDTRARKKLIPRFTLSF